MSKRKWNKIKLHTWTTVDHFFCVCYNVGNSASEPNQISFFDNVFPIHSKQEYWIRNRIGCLFWFPFTQTCRNGSNQSNYWSNHLNVMVCIFQRKAFFICSVAPLTALSFSWLIHKLRDHCTFLTRFETVVEWNEIRRITHWVLKTHFWVL